MARTWMLKTCTSSTEHHYKMEIWRLCCNGSLGVKRRTDPAALCLCHSLSSTGETVIASDRQRTRQTSLSSPFASPPHRVAPFLSVFSSGKKALAQPPTRGNRTLLIITPTLASFCCASPFLFGSCRCKVAARAHPLNVSFLTQTVQSYLFIFYNI